MSIGKMIKGVSKGGRKTAQAIPGVSRLGPPPQTGGGVVTQPPPNPQMPPPPDMAVGGGMGGLMMPGPGMGAPMPQMPPQPMMPGGPPTGGLGGIAELMRARMQGPQGGGASSLLRSQYPGLGG